MGHGGRTPAVRSAILILLILVPGTVRAQALLLPPLPLREPSGAQGFLPDVSSWAGFRHFPPGWGGTYHNHVLDFGSAITLCAIGPLSVDGMVRQVLLARPHPDGEWLFWLAALYTDLRLGVRWNAEPWEFVLAYRHDCKHDIEAYYGRDAAHDTVALSAGLPCLRWDWPGSGAASRLGAAAEAARNVPLLFQYNPPEPDLFRLSAQIDWEPWRAPGWPAPFLSGGLALIGRSRDTRVAVTETMALDWNVRAGLRLAGTDARAGTLAAYGQLESLGDDWMGLAPARTLLFSYGLLLGF